MRTETNRLLQHPLRLFLLPLRPAKQYHHHHPLPHRHSVRNWRQQHKQHDITSVNHNIKRYFYPFHHLDVPGCVPTLAYGTQKQHFQISDTSSIATAYMYLLQKVAQVEESSVVLRVNIQRSPVIHFSLLGLLSQGAQIIQSTGMSRVQSIQNTEAIYRFT